MVALLRHTIADHLSMRVGILELLITAPTSLPSLTQALLLHLDSLLFQNMVHLAMVVQVRMLEAQEEATRLRRPFRLVPLAQDFLHHRLDILLPLQCLAVRVLIMSAHNLVLCLLRLRQHRQRTRQQVPPLYRQQVHHTRRPHPHIRRSHQTSIPQHRLNTPHLVQTCIRLLPAQHTLRPRLRSHRLLLSLQIAQTDFPQRVPYTVLHRQIGHPQVQGIRTLSLHQNIRPQVLPTRLQVQTSLRNLLATTKSRLCINTQKKKDRASWFMESGGLAKSFGYTRLVY